jgi:uncharacterized protein (TIGR02996 family)
MTTRPEQTDTGRGLLRAICEDPWDDTPRLIFADFLDDLGQAERAEFIRRDVAYDQAYKEQDTAYKERDTMTREQRRERWEEHQRVYDAVRQYEPDWTWPMRELFGGDVEDVSYDRGLVGQVCVPAGLFVRHAAALFRVQPVTMVTLTADDGKWIGADVDPHEDPYQWDEHGTTRLYRDGRGVPAQRVPAELFPFLARVGVPVRMYRNVAVCPPRAVDATWGHAIVSYAAVAYGRDAAGLSPLTDEQWRRC